VADLIDAVVVGGESPIQELRRNPSLAMGGIEPHVCQEGDLNPPALAKNLRILTAKRAKTGRKAQDVESATVRTTIIQSPGLWSRWS
jgi:hypothetical protein